MAGSGLPLPSKPTITTTFNPITPIPSVYDCNFEKDYCNWKNDVSRPILWKRNRGYTSSDETGPTIDHTLVSILFYLNQYNQYENIFN